jgi:tetrathionate reductase subunit B
MKKEIKWGMVIDLRRCVGCFACQVACKAEHETPLGVWRIWVKTIQKGTYPEMATLSLPWDCLYCERPEEARYPRMSVLFLPWLCNHCDRPICNTVCPVGAAYKRKEDGIVMIDPHRCIGCNYCRAACPYNVRFPNPITGMIQKCDFCVHRVDSGLLPACVEACPTNAMVFGNLKDPSSKVSQLISKEKIQVLKKEMATYPNVYYINLDKDVADPLQGWEKHYYHKEYGSL